MSGFSVGWDAGPSSQIEVSSPDPQTQAGGYRLKFMPPFRSTLRPPQQVLRLTQNNIDSFRRRLSDLFVAADARGGEAAAAPSSADIITKTKILGGQLLDSIAQQNVQDQLRDKDLYLEIGIDEPLIELPWELLHDGSEYLCLKHRVARFVNLVQQQTIPTNSRPDPWTAGPLSVLIISVPIPQKRDGQPEFKLLTAVQKETEALISIIDSLGSAAKRTTLVGSQATFDAVYQAIGAERYHIIHYSGHAFFNADKPDNSSLCLFDRDMEAGDIVAYIGKKPPVLSFMNGCETAAMNTGVKNRYDIFSLARAFLDTGSYLIGNRWKVGDEAAAAFAGTFYRKLLIEGQPLGQVIRDARKECKAKMPDYDFSWASYIFYGDPRLCFRRL